MNKNLLILFLIVLIGSVVVFFYTRPYYKAVTVYDDYATYDEAYNAAITYAREINGVPIGRRGTGSNDWAGSNMGKTGIFVGDLYPYEKLEVGMLIGWTLEEKRDGITIQSTIIHRIALIDKEGVHTRGDANSTMDKIIVTPDNYQFRVVALFKPTDSK